MSLLVVCESWSLKFREFLTSQNFLLARVSPLKVHFRPFHQIQKLDVIMSVSIPGGVHFDTFFESWINWSLFDLVMKFDKLIDMVIGSFFRKKFMWFDDLGPKSRVFWFTNLPWLIKNQLWWACCFLHLQSCSLHLQRRALRRLKIVNILN